MNWEEALILLSEHIVKDLHLDPNTAYKIVREIPPYQCRNYNNDKGYRVQVGKKSFVNVPLIMLKTIFEAAVLNNNTYNNRVFAGLYPTELKNRPCNVHAIGKLFSNARIMQELHAQNYVIN